MPRLNGLLRLPRPAAGSPNATPSHHQASVHAAASQVGSVFSEVCRTQPLHHPMGLQSQLQLLSVQRVFDAQLLNIHKKASRDYVLLRGLQQRLSGGDPDTSHVHIKAETLALQPSFFIPLDFFLLSGFVDNVLVLSLLADLCGSPARSRWSTDQQVAEQGITNIHG
ncbi:hypothetical protein EYF80_032358 [Liparis tanakae]|uniref:Uncharacterized protein n=1 Tax=Liparis tanakae TaxID=230148 RepID=A0A4Z2GVB8_9TELE|nr:hypothetical protein EYF80_032358 [Liparis tanakae]